MSGDKFLLDTNIVLYILNGEQELISFINKQHLYISVITEMELLSFPSISKQEMQIVGNFINELDIMSSDDRVKEVAISIRRKHKLKLPDSIVAATAIVYDLPLITADKQFKVVGDLQLLLYDPLK